jgi:hypothetical protein
VLARRQLAGLGPSEPRTRCSQCLGDLPSFCLAFGNHAFAVLLQHPAVFDPGGVQAMQPLPEPCVSTGALELLGALLILGGHWNAGMDGGKDPALCFSVEAVGQLCEPLVQAGPEGNAVRKANSNKCTPLQRGQGA